LTVSLQFSVLASTFLHHNSILGGTMRSTVLSVSLLLLAFGGGHADFAVEEAAGADEGMELLQLRGATEAIDEEEPVEQGMPLLMEEPNILESHDLLVQALLESDDALVVALVEGSVAPEDLDDDDLAHLSMYQEDEDEENHADEEQDEETQTDDEADDATQAEWGGRRRADRRRSFELRRRWKAPHISIKVSLPKIPIHIPSLPKIEFKKVLSTVAKAAVASAKFVVANPLGALQCAKCLQSACLCLGWKSCPPCAAVMKKLLEYAQKKIGHKLDAQMGVFKKFSGTYKKLMDSPVGKFATKYGKMAKDLSNPSALVGDIMNEAKDELAKRAKAKFEELKAKAKAEIMKKLQTMPGGDFVKKYGKYAHHLNDPAALANDMKIEAEAEAKAKFEELKAKAKAELMKKMNAMGADEFVKKYGKYAKDLNNPAALAEDMKIEAEAEAWSQVDKMIR